jgi:hypothetical protein
MSQNQITPSWIRVSGMPMSSPEVLQAKEPSSSRSRRVFS